MHLPTDLRRESGRGSHASMLRRLATTLTSPASTKPRSSRNRVLGGSPLSISLRRGPRATAAAGRGSRRARRLRYSRRRPPKWPRPPIGQRAEFASPRSRTRRSTTPIRSRTALRHAARSDHTRVDETLGGGVRSAPLGHSLPRRVEARRERVVDVVEPHELQLVA